MRRSCRAHVARNGAAEYCETRTGEAQAEIAEAGSRPRARARACERSESPVGLELSVVPIHRNVVVGITAFPILLQGRGRGGGAGEGREPSCTWLSLWKRKRGLYRAAIKIAVLYRHLSRLRLPVSRAFFTHADTTARGEGGGESSFSMTLRDASPSSREGRGGRGGGEGEKETRGQKWSYHLAPRAYSSAGYHATSRRRITWR